MATDARVLELLEEMLESGQTPEEVCRDCPELLSKVQERWNQFGLVDAQLSAMFPDPGTRAGARAARRAQADHALPQIPGYEVEAVLGHGGMGVVYKARHLRLNRPVALKMLLNGPFTRKEERERFLQEAKAVASLRHPNIVQVHDCGDLDGRPYFTMEFVEGGTLSKKLLGTPLPAREAAELLLTLADAVQAAHEGGIVHRDLKPSNVLLAADGTPKVSDFGLARRADGGPELTRTGVAVGTPSYMSPCQARGDKTALSPATDVYALGAILYECLTGRPPFKAESSLETLQQVLTQDPVSPARLNARVPRDLETICLKCLEKDPAKRYPSAHSLADDLRRFVRGEPIVARPLGRLGRLARWCRRQPAAAALFGVLILTTVLALALVGGGLWLDGQRREAARSAATDLDEADRLLESDLAGAREAVERARGRLGSGGPAGLRDRVEQTEHAIRQRAEQIGQTRELATRLESVRLDRVIIREGRLNRTRSDERYEEEFKAAEMAVVGDDPQRVADRLAASIVRRELVAALDDWAICTDDVRRRAWILTVARAADPHPWRDLVRDPDPKAWKDRARLAQLADTARLDQEPVHLLVALGHRLQDDSGDREAVEFLRRVQQVHPADFFANYMLGNALSQTGDAVGAVGHFRAALAVRPDAANAWYGLGVALREAGRPAEAEAALRECVRISPSHGWAHAQLGTVLRWQGKADEAIEHLRQAQRLSRPQAWSLTELARAFQNKQRWEEAIECYRAAAALEPDNPWAHYNLGMALNTPGRQDEALKHLRKAASLEPDAVEIRTNLGLVLIARDRSAEAVEHLRAAVALEPSNTVAQYRLRTTLIRLGRPEEARAAWGKALEAGPKEHDAWFGHAELCLFLGKEDEYRQARRDLLARFRNATDPHVAERVSRACLLLSGGADELRQAVRLAEQAVAAEGPEYIWARPYFHFALGLAHYRRGRFDDAIATMTGDASKAAEYLGPSPRLVTAMALHQKGQKDEARKMLAAAIASYDWSAAKADNRDAWIVHVLRREAESLIEPTVAPDHGR